MFDVIRKILEHLEIDAKLPVPAPSRAPPGVQEELDWRVGDDGLLRL